MKKKILLGLSAAAAIAIPLAAVAGSASAAQPTTTTHNITMEAASEEVIDLPALNSQFTQMVITVDGRANWGEEAAGYWTAYAKGVYVGTGATMTSGSTPGPLLLEGSQVGVVIYRVDGGVWQEVDGAPITVEDGKHVQVAYNDRPNSYDDNFGSLSLTVLRTKA